MPINFQEYLLQKQWVKERKLQEAIRSCSTHQKSLISYLIEQKWVCADQIATMIHELFQLPIQSSKDWSSETMDAKTLPIQLMREFRVVPLKKTEEAIDVLMTDPTNFRAIEAIQFHTGLTVIPHLGSDHDIENCIANLTDKRAVDALHRQKAAVSLKLETFDLSKDGDEPLIHFVNRLLEDAIEKNASDIHVEPFEEYCRIRFRIHGILTEEAKLPYHLSKRFIARLKIMSQLDITEQRLPQDGHCKVKLSENKTADIRVCTCPVLFGEKMVLRFLHQKQQVWSLDQLDLEESQKNRFLKALQKPQGLILVTGPTGSGKTTTLYAALSHLNQVEKNILTVEDPVEIAVDGINQVTVNSKIELSFGRVLRSFLRLDPNVIMVGEIRDAETAEIAIKASETGHLVLSTLHTNSAPEVIVRLLHMGIAPYHLASSLNLITAQRLMRRICSLCKGQGCDHCCHGYQGRFAIHEVLPVDDHLSQLILNKASLPEFLAYMKQQNIERLCDIAKRKMESGETDEREALRVIGEI